MKTTLCGILPDEHLYRHVAEAFGKQPNHDGTSLGPYLWQYRKTANARRVLAVKILERLEALGRLARDGRGWWVPVEGRAIAD